MMTKVYLLVWVRKEVWNGWMIPNTLVWIRFNALLPAI